MDDAMEWRARRQAWERAKASGSHQIVLEREGAAHIVALPDLVIRRGDVVLAVVSPYLAWVGGDGDEDGEYDV